MKSFYSSVQDSVHVYGPTWIIENPFFLLSVEGGKQQVLHKDFTTEDMGLAPKDHFFAGLLISLEDKTPFFHQQ